MNPLLPNQYCIPDVEAHQWRDGRMYLYGSYDIPGDDTYCSRKYHVFSSPDLTHWTDHGMSFQSADAHGNKDAHLYAPDCMYLNGRYYLCYCGSDGQEGIAVGEFPYGPFRNSFGIQGADGDAIDPAILLDDDGSVYFFWGQGRLRGARLMPDLSSIDQSTLHPAIINEAEHGFHEGVSIRKRGGVYYLVYTDTSRGKATSLGYATSASPLGPYTKHGILIDNMGCDPETWNNHGSIAEFNGKWYLFYHRSSQASKYNRRVCVEPIHFDADGRIAEVEMTSQGISAPLCATTPIDAYRACVLFGSVRTATLYPEQEAEVWSEHLSWIHNGDWAAYKYLDFGGGVATFNALVASPTCGGTIEVHADAVDGPLVCVCDVPVTGGWNQWVTVSAKLQSSQSGVHAVYLVFKGDRSGNLFNLQKFWFG